MSNSWGFVGAVAYFMALRALVNRRQSVLVRSNSDSSAHDAFQAWREDRRKGYAGRGPVSFRNSRKTGKTLRKGCLSLDFRENEHVDTSCVAKHEPAEVRGEGRLNGNRECDMTRQEIFSQSRMYRCARITRLIMDAWRTTKSFQYLVEATESLEGLTLDELRKQNFNVRIQDDLTEIPFTDFLVVFSMIAQENQARKIAAKELTKHGENTIRVEYQITTDFPDEEVLKMLAEIRIETPLDSGKYLRIQRRDN
ncbi:MAG: hypothetical protein N2C14_05990 [Planctomycetales bacterium]